MIVPAVPVPSPTAPPAPDHPQQTRLDIVQKRAIDIRRLYPKRPIERAFITRGELGSNVLELLEEDRGDILIDQKLYLALGLLEPEDNLFDIWVDLLSENVAGYYHLEEETLYVITDSPEFSPLDLVTHAHETTHALQQQNYDIYAARQALEDRHDASRAFTALVEGDASIVEAIYMLEFLTEEELLQAQEESAAAAGDSLRNAPYVVRRLFFFPYFEGFEFVRGLLEYGGWETVNDAYANPPQSTEHILHVNLYGAGEAPLEVAMPDLAAALGEGWAELRRNTFGEMLLRTYLETGMNTVDAHVAAAGWGGDTYSLLEGPDGALALAASTVWDSDEDAGEFVDAFLEHLRARLDLEWEPLDDAGAAFRANAGAQTVSISRRGLTVAITFAPTADVADALAAALAE